MWPFGKKAITTFNDKIVEEVEEEKELSVETKKPATLVDQILFSFRSLPDQWKCLANDCWYHKASDIYISLVNTKTMVKQVKGDDAAKSYPPMLYRWITIQGATKQELQQIYALSDEEVKMFREAYLEMEANRFLEAAFMIDPNPSVEEE